MIKKYRKKPVEIEAVQYMGDNAKEIEDFVGQILLKYDDNTLGIPTLEGIMKASIGDYIIKGIVGECYPCKPNVFRNTYDEM